MANKPYKGYYFEKHKPGGYDIYASEEVTTQEGKKAFCGWAPNLDTAKYLVEAFIQGRATPWYESETAEMLLEESGGDPREGGSNYDFRN
jgi:hypothetical protein